MWRKIEQFVTIVCLLVVVLFEFHVGCGINSTATEKKHVYAFLVHHVIP